MEPTRGLTLREFRTVTAMADKTDADAAAVALTCGVTEADAQAWFDTVPVGEALALIGKVMELSGLTDTARFQGGQADDAQPERAGV